MSDISKYLYNYLIDLKQNQIKNNYNNAKSLYKNITKFVERYTVKHPDNVSFLLNGGNNNSINKHGGAIDEEFIENMGKIQTVFKLYKDINGVDIQQNARQLELQVDNILRDVKHMHADTDLRTVQIEDKIINNLKILQVDATNFASGLQINVGNLSIPIVSPIDLHDLPDEAVTNKIITEIHDKINQMHINIDSNGRVIGVHVEAFLRYILEHTRNIMDLISKINIVLEPLQEEITKVYISETFNYESTNLHKIISITELKQKIARLMFMSDAEGQIIKTSMESVSSDRVKEKDYIDMYNVTMLLVSDDYLSHNGIPRKYFNGRYAKRITNNFLMTESDISNKMNIIAKLVKDGEVSYKTRRASIDNLKDMFAPDLKTMFQPTVHVGGAKIDELENYSATCIEAIHNYLILRKSYVETVKEYNICNVQTITHTMFLSLIITNQLFTTDYVIYEYINKGTITFYQRIVDGIIEKIDNKNNSDEILYFKKYHMLTLRKLKSFLDKLSTNMIASDVIDINKCSGDTANRFLLLNYFKSILESYRELYQNKITIYARINDIITPIKPDVDQFEIFKNNKMFMSDTERFNYVNLLKSRPSVYTDSHITEALKNKTIKDTRIMYVRKRACSAYNAAASVSDRIKEYKFTEVFDTTEFPNNGDISKYMTLDTQLSKGKGVAIMTYGYSGTGKTYTLFGSASQNKQGILQSTLENINGLKSVYFRLYEMYGYGLPYPHYWAKGAENISHKIFKYKLNLTIDKLVHGACEEVDAAHIANYVKEFTFLKRGSDKSNYSSYIQILGPSISNIFAKFDEFMDEIETVRKGNPNNAEFQERRIRDTPNNIVSSRSVLIYDFVLEVGEEKVPFLIIDLPGREEIAQTYVDPFIHNPLIRQIFSYGYDHTPPYTSSRAAGGPSLATIHSTTEEENPTITYNLNCIKMMLATMAINPVALPIFAPNEVFEFINEKLTPAERNLIFNKPIQMAFDQNNVSDKITGDFMLSDEYINRIGWQINKIYKFDSSHKITITSTDLYGYTTDEQRKALICIHIINRIILLNQTKILYNLFKYVVDKKLNKYLIAGVTNIISTNRINSQIIFEQLMNSSFKGELINNLTPEEKLNIEKLKQVIQYDYYLTPLEGIYINENIAGLIKFLGEKMITDATKKQKYLDEFKKKHEQSTTLDFVYQQKMARVQLMSANLTIDVTHLQLLLNIEGALPNKLIDRDGTIIKNNDVLNTYYTKLMESYKSDGIFNFETPLITNILTPYLSSINDYKVFYLFGNYNEKALGDLKCEHQNKLLKNTEDFIKIITAI